MKAVFSEKIYVLPTIYLSGRVKIQLIKTVLIIYKFSILKDLKSLNIKIWGGVLKQTLFQTKTAFRNLTNQQTWKGNRPQKMFSISVSNFLEQQRLRLMERSETVF